MSNMSKPSVHEVSDAAVAAGHPIRCAWCDEIATGWGYFRDTGDKHPSCGAPRHGTGWSETTMRTCLWCGQILPESSSSGRALRSDVLWCRDGRNERSSSSPCQTAARRAKRLSRAA